MSEAPSENRKLSLTSIGGKEIDFRVDQEGDLVVVVYEDDDEQDFCLAADDLSKLRDWLNEVLP